MVKLAKSQGLFFVFFFNAGKWIAVTLTMLGQRLRQSIGEQKLLIMLLDSREDKCSVTLVSVSQIVKS